MVLGVKLDAVGMLYPELALMLDRAAEFIHLRMQILSIYSEECLPRPRKMVLMFTDW